MARAIKKDPPKPLFPLKYEFAASLDRYIHEAAMMADALRTVLSHGTDSGLKSGVVELLKERLDAFDEARGL